MRGAQESLHGPGYSELADRRLTADDKVAVERPRGKSSVKMAIYS